MEASFFKPLCVTGLESQTQRPGGLGPVSLEVGRGRIKRPASGLEPVPAARSSLELPASGRVKHCSLQRGGPPELPGEGQGIRQTASEPIAESTCNVCEVSVGGPISALGCI